MREELAVKKFWDRVDQSTEDKCWPWTGAKSMGTGEYGTLRFLKQSRQAHWVAFYLAYGRWPQKTLGHTCGRRDCCNPAHLVEGTSALYRKGTAHPLSKLTPAAVIRIRDAHASGEMTISALAREFGVTPMSIRQVLSGKAWSHV